MCTKCVFVCVFCICLSISGMHVCEHGHTLSSVHTARACMHLRSSFVSTSSSDCILYGHLPGCVGGCVYLRVITRVCVCECQLSLLAVLLLWIISSTTDHGQAAFHSTLKHRKHCIDAFVPLCAHAHINYSMCTHTQTQELEILTHIHKTICTYVQHF